MRVISRPYAFPDAHDNYERSDGSMARKRVATDDSLREIFAESVGKLSPGI